MVRPCLCPRKSHQRQQKNTTTTIDSETKGKPVMNRRQFFTGAATVAGGALLTRLIPAASAAEPGKAATSTGKTESFAPAGVGYKPVITPNGHTLPRILVPRVEDFPALSLINLAIV